MKKKKMRWVEEGIYRTSPNAKYSIDIVMPNSDGTIERIRRRISKDLKETRKELYNLREKREKGIRGVPDMSVTLKEMIAQFREHSKANAFKPNSIERAEGVFKTIEQYFGPDTKLIALTFEKIEAYIIKRHSEGANQGTILLEFITIRKLFDLAIKSNYLQKNPCSGIKLRS